VTQWAKFCYTNKLNYRACVKEKHSWRMYLQTLRINGYVSLIHEPLVSIGIIPAWWNLKRNIKRASTNELIALIIGIALITLIVI
jgi:hypothetical protein